MSANVDLLGARDIAIQALAGNADPCNAREVIDFGLGQLGYQLTTLQAACRDGLRHEILDVSLIVLQERVEALQKFADAFLDVRFAPLKEAP